ncbi:ribonuclease E inhibitor RraB [Archangium violaceum]|uniref:ribonuclease E inhibitor RraB n=1 Tax=Archangium violaceum TaxID=83451 RepID=UPI0019505F57|nr:ribonuclease E inhibitor RraB [Archangium violaceum]QRN94568.1 ribonuclease E inhibitor RraB [Archangium violaceum]
MTTQRKRARPGDILEVKTPRGLAYVHYTYVSKDPYWEVLRILPGFFTTRPADFTALVNNPGAYFAFYPARAAVSQGLVDVVAHQPVQPGQEFPASYRRAGARSRNGRILAWLIHEGTKETLVRELTKEQRHLPIASFWMHDVLVTSLTEEWRPEQDIGIPPEPEGTVASSAEPKSEESPSEDSKPRHVRHYLYFTTAKVGKAVAAQLTTRGFEVTSRKSADGKNWLVLVEHFVSDGEQFDSARESLEHLAQEHSGQYDGYELEVASNPK